MSAMVLAAAGCSSTIDTGPPDVRTMSGPCEFLTTAERDALGLGAGTVVDEAPMGTGGRTALCVFRVAGPRAGAHVDSVSVTFLPTPLDVARRALDEVEGKGIFTAGRMSAYAEADGVLRREGTRLGEPTCERLFGVSGDRSVQVGMTVEGLPSGESPCAAAARLAPAVDARIPRQPSVPE